MDDNNNKGYMNTVLIVFIVIFAIVIIGLLFSGTQYFKNLTYAYNLPIVGTVPNIQAATVPRMINLGRGFNMASSEEPSSEEPSSHEIYNIYSDQSMLIGMYSNERKNMNPFGDYRLITSMNKQKSKEIDNLFQRLRSASNSAFIQ